MRAAHRPDEPPEPGAEDILRFLRSPAAHAAHAGAGARVEVVETHMSWVFLVGAHVLKLKKAVRHPFLDFSTPARRAFYCREELRLNRRLAPEVYRGLMALHWHDGRLALRPEAELPEAGRTLDWLVWMRRLPAERMLDHAIAARRVTPADIDAVVGRLAAFYRGAARPPLSGRTHVAAMRRQLADDRAVLLGPAPGGLPQAAPALDAMAQALAGSRRLLLARVDEGRIVDGHGDLRPEHVALLDPPVVIDCLEFSAALRRRDPFDELAFLGLECEMAGAPWVMARLVAGASRALADHPPARLLHLYVAGRALLRARLAMAHLLDAEPRLPARWPPLARRHLARAQAALADWAADAPFPGLGAGA
jgi:aminoglycoside phosphotransferase family enzyme